MALNTGSATLPRRLIIMPAYNESENLPRVIPAVKAAAPGYDLVVIDDGSRDNTARLAAELGANVVSLPVNLGYGGAVQTGFRYAVRHGYDLGVVIDADGQHDPAGIHVLADAVVQGGADVVIGSRFRGQLQYRRAVGEANRYDCLRLDRLADHRPAGHRSDVRVSGAERRSHAFLRHGQLPGGLPGC